MLEAGSEKKLCFFSACVIGAGTGRDSSPSPVQLQLPLGSEMSAVRVNTESLSSRHVDYSCADADDQPKGPSVVTPRVGLGLGRGTLDHHHRVNPSERLNYDSCGRGAEEGIIDRKERHCYNDAHSSDSGDVHTTTTFNDDMMTIRRR